MIQNSLIFSMVAIDCSLVLMGSNSGSILVYDAFQKKLKHTLKRLDDCVLCMLRIRSVSASECVCACVCACVYECCASGQSVPVSACVRVCMYVCACVHVCVRVCVSLSCTLLQAIKGITLLCLCWTCKWSSRVL